MLAILKWGMQTILQQNKSACLCGKSATEDLQFHTAIHPWHGQEFWGPEITLPH